MSEIIIGIDPGLTGGIAALSKKGDFLKCSPMPIFSEKKNKKAKEFRYIDIERIDEFLDEFFLLDFFHVFLEKSQPMPHQGVTSTFNYGVNFGMLFCHFKYMEGSTLEFVSPVRWKKDLQITSDKESSIELVKKLYPQVNLKRTDRCKNEHDGMAEAILIAHWGLMKLNNSSIINV